MLRIVAVVAFVMMVIAVLFALNRLPEQYMSHSTRSDGMMGTSVAYYSLDRLGYKVARSYEPLKEYRSDSVLMLLHPERKYTGAEISVLRRWLAAGRWIVTNYGSMDGGFGTPDQGTPTAKSKPRKFMPVAASKHPLMSRVKLRHVRSALLLRSTLVPLENGQKLAQIDGMSKPTVVLQKVGRGGIIYVPFELFTNSRVAKYGDDVLLVNIARLGGGRVVFNEYQPTTSEANWGFIGVFKGSSSVSLLVWFVAFLLVIWAFGTRFGPPMEIPRVERYRGEQLDAIAGPLMKVEAHSTVAQILARNFLVRMGTVCGVPKSMDPLVLADALKNHRRMTPEARLAVVDAEACLRGNVTDTKRLLDMARKWNDTLREINKLWL